MNRKNEQKIENANINNSIVLQTGGDLYLTDHFFKELANIQGNTRLLNSLIKEKIKKVLTKKGGYANILRQSLMGL